MAGRCACRGGWPARRGLEAGRHGHAPFAALALPEHMHACALPEHMHACALPRACPLPCLYPVPCLQESYSKQVRVLETVQQQYEQEQQVSSRQRRHQAEERARFQEALKASTSCQLESNVQAEASRVSYLAVGRRRLSVCGSLPCACPPLLGGCTAERRAGKGQAVQPCRRHSLRPPLCPTHPLTPPQSPPSTSLPHC